MFFVLFIEITLYKLWYNTIYSFRDNRAARLPRPPQVPGRVFPGAVCSPAAAKPYGSVPGSKFFTHSPRRHRRSAGFSRARFAPRCPLALVLPFRGAKSSHNSRAAARGRPAFPRRGLLPAPGEPLRLRSGEQILHTISAPPPGAGRFFEARFAPRSLQTLAAPFRGANSSHNFRAAHQKFPRRPSPREFLSTLFSSTYPFPVAGIPEPGNSPLLGGLPCRKAGIPQSSSG